MVRLIRRPFLLCILIVAAPGWGCHSLRQLIVKSSDPAAFEPQGDPSEMKPVYDGPDEKRHRVPISLVPVFRGFEQPVDIQFVPGSDTLFVVLEKLGHARWGSLETHQKGPLLQVDVLQDSEQGLLGLAFHPLFLQNGKFYIKYSTRSHGKDVNRIQEWQADQGPAELRNARPLRTIIEVEQPYASHNAGQLFFGTDGYLYAGWGDGGWDGDPDNNGQNTRTLLGSIVRLDIDHPGSGKEYGIPADNPFAGNSEGLPEIWAWGFRNPWRASLLPDDRVIVGDVGQNRFEEISVVEKGKNYGWRIREGRHCFKPSRDCPSDGLIDPIYEYAHGENGRSITAGYVYTGRRVPELTGKFIFGDFITGRIWAIDVPVTVVPGAPLAVPVSLGRWPILIPTFGRNFSGDVFLLDFSSGTLFAISPALPD